MSRGKRVLVVAAVLVVLGVVGWMVVGGSDRDAGGAPAWPEPSTVPRVESDGGGEVSPGVPGGGSGAGSPSQEGARRAAIAYTTGTQDWLYLSDTEVDEAVRAMATPEAGDRLSDAMVADIAAAREALRGVSGDVWWLLRPLATRINGYDGRRAQVSVWTVGVLSAPGVAVPQSDWATATVELVWSGDAWLVDGASERVGPTPVTGVRDEPWPSASFADALLGFDRVGGEEVW